jgi:hypothetical protein
MAKKSFKPGEHKVWRGVSRHPSRLICKILDLRFPALPDEITACDSSLGGESASSILPAVE